MTMNCNSASGVGLKRFNTRCKIVACLLTTVFAFSVDIANAVDTTFRVNLDIDGHEDPDGYDFGLAKVSDDGRYIAYESKSGNLVPADDLGYIDVFYLDRKTGELNIISKNLSGELGNHDTFLEDMTPDGRYVVISTEASDLVIEDESTEGISKVYVIDTSNNTIELVCKSSNGDIANGYCWSGSISDDGRYVAFGSNATNLVEGDDEFFDVFVHDRVTGETTLESVYSDESAPDLFVESGFPKISGDGRYLVFTSYRSTTGSSYDGVVSVFIRNRETGRFVSVGDRMEDLYNSMPDHFSMTDHYESENAHISRDGRFVVFHSYATLSTDPDRYDSNIIRYDTALQEFEFVDVNTDGWPIESSWESSAWLTGLSNDGRYISFTSAKGHELDALLVDDGEPKLFFRDMESRYTAVASLTNNGNPAPISDRSFTINGMSDSAAYVLFVSPSDTVVDGDTNSAPDLFLHKMLDIGIDGDDLDQSPLDDINLIESPFGRL